MNEFHGTFNTIFRHSFIIKDRESFFTEAQRSLIVWQILLRTKYGSHNPNKIGIVRLLSNKTYKAAYPLHDGRWKDYDDDDDDDDDGEQAEGGGRSRANTAKAISYPAKGGLETPPLSERRVRRVEVLCTV